VKSPNQTLETNCRLATPLDAQRQLWAAARNWVKSGDLKIR